MATYPQGTYVNILDGVAGSLYFTNRPAGQGLHYNSSATKLLTLSRGGEGAVRAEPRCARATTDWHLTATAVVASGAAPDRTLKVSYKGTALPAMPNNALPAGWALIQQPWEVWDEVSGVQTGFVDTQAVGVHTTGGVTYYRPPQPRVFFVPNFKFAAASTTPTLVDGTDQTWSLYLLKPLNANQVPTLTVTTPMFGGTTLLQTTPVYNTFKQLIRLDVKVPLGGQHPQQAANTFRVQAPFSLTYLKGEQIVTETIPYDETFNVTISAGTDTIPPVITNFRQTLPADISGDPDAAQMCYLQSGGYTYAGGIVAVQGTAVDSNLGGGLDRAELWVEGVVPREAQASGARPWAAEKVATLSLAGVRGPVPFRVKWDTRTFALDKVGATCLTVKLYDTAGNVTTASLPNAVYVGVALAKPTIGINGVRVLGTNRWLNDPDAFGWTTVTGWAAEVQMAPMFVRSVVFTVNGTPVVPPAGRLLVENVWDPVKGPSTRYTLNQTVPGDGTFTLGVIVTDTCGNVRPTSRQIAVGSYGGGDTPGPFTDPTHQQYEERPDGLS